MVFFPFALSKTSVTHTNSRYSRMHRKLAIGHEHWTGMARKLVLSWKHTHTHREQDRKNQISGCGQIWKGIVTERERLGKKDSCRDILAY